MAFESQVQNLELTGAASLEVRIFRSRRQYYCPLSTKFTRISVSTFTAFPFNK